MSQFSLCCARRLYSYFTNDNISLMVAAARELKALHVAVKLNVFCEL